MTEFVGRTGAQRVYSYPENPRAAALGLFARNFATGPKVSTEISGATLIPWNAIDTTAKAFSIAAGGVTVHIAGDVTALFNSGDNVSILPLVPATLPVVAGTIATVPAFAGGETTFDLTAPIDGSTLGGAIENNSTPTVNVPITPRATGVVLVTGVVGIINGSGSPVNASVTVEANGIPVPVVSFAAIGDGTNVTIPFMAEVFLPIGLTSSIQVSVTGDNADLLADGSAINVQEVSISTG
jgi:hypothetical protein